MLLEVRDRRVLLVKVFPSLLKMALSLFFLVCQSSCSDFRNSDSSLLKITSSALSGPPGLESSATTPSDNMKVWLNKLSLCCKLSATILAHRASLIADEAAIASSDKGNECVEEILSVEVVEVQYAIDPWIGLLWTGCLFRRCWHYDRLCVPRVARRWKREKRGIRGICRRGGNEEDRQSGTPLINA